MIFWQKWMHGMQSETKFRRCPLYKETYFSRIKPYPKLRAKLRDFMELKRHQPDTPFGGNDKFFKPGFKFFSAIPGLRHAHLAPDLYIVYRIGEAKEIFLYGIFTHDDLGIGQPMNPRKQDTMSSRLAGQVCT